VQSRAALLPQISGSSRFTDNEGDSSSTRTLSINPLITSRSSGESESRGRNHDVTLNQSIYNRANYTGLRASRARAQQATLTYEAASQALIVRTADAYFGVLTAIETLTSARAEERAVKRQLDQAEKRLEVGLSPITDVHESRARYDSARAAAISAETVLEDSREALAEITGQVLQGLRGLGTDFKPQAPTPTEIEAWVKLALEQNPTLSARILELRASEHDVSTARAAHLPTLSGSISRSDSASWGQFTATGNPNAFPSASNGMDTTVGVTLSVPIFSGGATQSRVRQAIHTRDATADVVEQEQRSVTRQTRNAYRSLLAGLSEIEARQQALVSARSALEATEAGFEVGTRTIVDVLISQQQLFSAQREHARARHSFLVNDLRLKQQAGSVAIGDVQAINALLVADAEAALDEDAQ
jgi:outer membrane protein